MGSTHLYNQFYILVKIVENLKWRVCYIATSKTPSLMICAHHQTTEIEDCYLLVANLLALGLHCSYHSIYNQDGSLQ